MRNEALVEEGRLVIDNHIHTSIDILRSPIPWRDAPVRLQPNQGACGEVPPLQIATGFSRWNPDAR